MANETIYPYGTGGQLPSSIGVVNDLRTGGADKALSAEMGKVLKTAISTLIDSMGEYCFPNGRPTLSWEGAKADIIPHFNNSHVSSSNTAQRVDIGASFETTLGTDDNLYVIDDDSVVVKMGGVTQVGAYAAATGKVTIAEVTDYIEITANAITYVGYGEQNSPLVFHLDGKNRGNNSGHWVDLAGNIDFTLNNCTENSDNVKFNGSTSYGEAPSGKTIDVLATSATVECAYSLDAAIALGSWSPILKNTIEGKVGFCLMNSSYDNNIYAGIEIATNPTTVSPILCANSSTAYLKGFASIKAKSAGGSGLTPEEGGYFNGSRTLQSSAGTSLGAGNTTLRIGINGSGATHFNGRLYSLRVYSRKLTDAEILQNYAVDQKRFNIL